MTDITHRDFLGQEIKDGDRVIIPDAWGYAGFNWGTVIAFTPKKVRVAYKSEHTSFGSGEKLLDPKSVLVMGTEQEHALTMKILKS
jgi:hypothetical protein